MMPETVLIGRGVISGPDVYEVEVSTIGELGSGGITKWLLVDTTDKVTDGSAGPVMVGSRVKGGVDVLFTVPMGQK